jgi:uncharacterized protein
MFEIKENLKNILAVILSLLFIALTVSVAVDINNKIKETENTITVSGTGSVYSQPELAMVNLSVISEAGTVEEAMNDNSEKMNAVISCMKEHGIEDKDLKTTSFNVYPRYEWQESTILRQGDSQRVLVGYEVRQSLEVKIRDMDKIGEIIEGGTDAGANQASDLYFTIDEETQKRLEEEAREEAIKQAKSKAKELAEQLEIKLIRISKFNENSSAYSPYLLRDSVAGMGEKESLAPQVQTGENKTEISVSLTYEIN